MDMIRPEYGDLARRLSWAYVACSCADILQTVEVIRAHWQMGHFDVPVTPEVIRAAVAEEREACAKIADTYSGEARCYFCDAAGEAAAEIRARGQIPTPADSPPSVAST